EPLFEVLEVGRQTQDRHHLGGDRDVEAGLARIAVGDPAQRADDSPQRPVVHAHDPAPGDASGIDAELVAPVDVVVDQCGKQIVGGGDGVEVAGEVQVHVLHRHDLRIATAGRPTLDAEIRPERGLADAYHRAFADAVQAVAQPHSSGGLALA